MTETLSKARKQAEIAFGKAQSEFMARSRAVEVVDPTVRAREEKTLRLRQAREAKELQDRLAAATVLPRSEKEYLTLDRMIFCLDWPNIVQV
ncbi:hypothetical protein [Rhizobium mulingense]|uniref:hypothetical protein n=1 Tax=Rhizobium mulingense TaxID=3031128 RepID=UPI002B495AAB|nr:hypothetical protein [Rhizobium sp. MJ21]MEB3044727.1 hypothetical protein [Rhizobium sp. MJ21]